MLSHQSIINSDDDDELPSLADRIKASLAVQKQNISHHISSESEDEDSSFLNFSKMIQSTPCTQVQSNQKPFSIEKIEESNVFKNTEKNNSQPLNIKLDFSLSSESEDEELQFLSFSQKIQSIPHVNVPAPHILESLCESDSDDEVFSNLAERLKMWTPKIENKENYNPKVVSDEVKKMSEFLTPLPPKKKSLVVDSESDESFSSFIEVLKTPLPVNRKEVNKTDSESDGSFTSFIQTLKAPMSVNRKISHKVTDSESDGSFSSFIERLRTPLSVNRKLQNKVTESDSDDLFLNKSRKPPFQTPKSIKKKLTNDVILPKIVEAKKCNSSLVVKNISHSAKASASNKNEKEFGALFDYERISSTFLLKRELYTRMLYKFFNAKVFNSQLPTDMPLFYDGALKTTAGITCCSMKNGIYTCSIKLSSSLLNSFDRLKETLLHEMCHAAVWIINKQRHVRHGPLWQVWASRCKLILPFIECPTRCHNYEISYRIIYQCPKCEWKKGSCKQLKKYHGALCKKCRSPIVMICN